MSEMAKESTTATLQAFGADFSRWPEGRAAAGRRLLVGDLGFRAAFEAESRLDEAFAHAREAEMADAALAGAAERIRRRLLARVRRGPFAAFRWRQVAAAMLLAGMLGGAIDLALVKWGAGGLDIAMLDPLAAIEGTDGE